MGFTLDDDEDDFWGDATTFGCARVPVAPSRRGAQIRIRPRATLFKPAAARAPQPPPIPRRRIPAPSPSSQGHRHVMQAGGGAG